MTKQLRRDNKYEDADDDAFDENGILKDGKSVRVGLMMRDGLPPLQRAVAQSSVSVTDGAGGATGLHRPGFRLAAADARRRTHHYDPKGRLRGYSEEVEEVEDAMCALDAAYADYEDQLVNAYRGNRPDAAEGSGETRDDLDSADHQQRMEEVYAAHDSELSQAWRRG